VWKDRFNCFLLDDVFRVVEGNRHQQDFLSKSFKKM
jgi:hypothetical protein